MNLIFKLLLLTMIALASISRVATANPYGSEEDNMGSVSMMEGHEYGSMGYGHGMEHQGYGGKDWMMTPHNGAIHFLHMKDFLGLNEKQVAELKALRDSYREENTIPEAKLKVAEESLKEIMEEDSINLEKAEAKIKEIGSLESGLWLSYVNQLTKIKTIITKEQLKKMWEMKHGGDGHPSMK